MEQQTVTHGTHLIYRYYSSVKHVALKSLMGGAIASLILSLSLLIVLMHVITPVQGGPLGILCVFILIYVSSTAAAIIIGTAIGAVSGRLGRARLTSKRQYYVSSVLGLLPVLYLTLLSMGGATVWGVGLVCLVVGLMIFYVLRRTA